MTEIISRDIPDLHFPSVEVRLIFIIDDSVQLIRIISRNQSLRKENQIKIRLDELQSIPFKAIIYPIQRLLRMLISTWDQCQQHRQLRMFSYRSFSHNVVENLDSRTQTLRAVPLWAKILIGVIAAIAVIGAIVGPAVYFGLAGQLLMRVSSLILSLTSCH